MNPSYLNTVQGVTQLYQILDSFEIGSSGGSPIPQNKWRYTVKPVALQTTGIDDSPVKGGSSDETFLRAWNVYETENDQNTAMGITLSGLPDGWDLQPIPDGTVVPGWYYQGGDQLTIFVAWPNQFDGVCE